MERRNRFLTFLTALIPGVGYMYLGLLKKGLQILVLFLLIKPVFSILDLNFLSSILQLSIWVYTFFDTFNTANKIDRGVVVEDSDFIFNKYSEPRLERHMLNKRFGITVAWTLIIVGTIAVLNKIFVNNDIYALIKNYINTYFFPVILVLTGVYILVKGRDRD